MTIVLNDWAQSRPDFQFDGEAIGDVASASRASKFADPDTQSRFARDVSNLRMNSYVCSFDEGGWLGVNVEFELFSV